ncbi:MAG: branched-chain amino acid transport system substrate-binding protein [Gaiellales bacterium]|jgi:branched-chain amino acid transport system substrate-binding protein|nr:branched-chain amino acid transport system substrate-binding protein [Gaiellales bacterium]
MTRNLFAFVAALAALSLVSVAAASTSDTPGVSSTQITIGSSGPLSGEAAAAAGVLRGADAYFKYVNARGGVFGRKIDFKYLDDAYDPSQTVQNVRQLVQQDNVFALFSVVGTNGNLAIRDFTNAAGIPQVFSAAGATTLGRDYAKYPWTIGYLPPYSEEGAIYARHILATAGQKAKIAVLYQSDDYGKDMLSGFRNGLGTKKKQIVQTVGYDPTASDVQSQVAQLKASGANTFAIFAFGKFAIQAFVYANKLGWKPQIYVNDVASASSIMKLDPQGTAEGAISVLWGKDPATPAFAKDPGVALAARIVKKYVPGGNPSDGFLVAGMAEAFTFVDALNHAGKNLTRKGLMNAVTHLNEASNPFLVPGVTVHTTPTMRFPISAVQLQRWHQGHWVPFGGVQSAKP